MNVFDFKIVGPLLCAGLLLLGCPLERTNPCDPEVCKTACQPGYSCNQGVCIKESENFCFGSEGPDGSVDLAVADGATADVDAGPVDQGNSDDAVIDATLDANVADATIDSGVVDAAVDADILDATVDANILDATVDAGMADAPPVVAVINGLASKGASIVCGQSAADDCKGTLTVILHTCSHPENCPDIPWGATVSNADLSSGSVVFTVYDAPQGQTLWASAFLTESGGQFPPSVSGDLILVGSVSVVTKVGIPVDMVLELTGRIP